MKDTKNEIKRDLSSFCKNLLFPIIVISITFLTLYSAASLVKVYIIDGAKGKNLVYGIVEVYIDSYRVQLGVFSSIYDESTARKFIDNMTRIANMPKVAIEVVEHKRTKYIVMKALETKETIRLCPPLVNELNETGFYSVISRANILLTKINYISIDIPSEWNIIGYIDLIGVGNLGQVIRLHIDLVALLKTTVITMIFVLFAYSFVTGLYVATLYQLKYRNLKGSKFLEVLAENHGLFITPFYIILTVSSSLNILALILHDIVLFTVLQTVAVFISLAFLIIIPILIIIVILPQTRKEEKKAKQNSDTRPTKVSLTYKFTTSVWTLIIALCLCYLYYFLLLFNTIYYFYPLLTTTLPKLYQYVPLKVSLAIFISIFPSALDIVAKYALRRKIEIKPETVLLIFLLYFFQIYLF